MKYDVCVFGGCSIDLTYYANKDGNYNTEPDIKSPGGKGSNQAVAASRAGAKTTIITRLGNDEIGKMICNNLINNNIDISNVELLDQVENDSATIYVNEINKDNDIKRTAGAIDSFTEDMIDNYSKVLLSSRIVVAQMKIPKEVSIKLINFCYENKIPIVITPCRPKKLSILEKNNIDLINKITYITCNREECEIVFGTTDYEKIVEKYPNKLIITLGEKGLIYHNGEKIVYLEAPQKNIVVDTTGAGDTFAGNFATFIAHGNSFEDAIMKAQYASGMKIMKETAQDGMPYIDELNNYIKKDLSKKINTIN